ncbi:MAG: DUF1801 domain-containing protein [Dehalococcoidia bacterium]
MPAKADPARDVAAYYKALPAGSRTALEELRQTILTVVPDAIEVISYQMPAFKREGKTLLHIAAFKEHYSMFPGPGIIEAHRAELAAYYTSKGTIRFALDKPAPKTLVKKLVKACVKEQDARLRERAERKGRSR